LWISNLFFRFYKIGLLLIIKSRTN
jgi:hypothetical protein